MLKVLGNLCVLILVCSVIAGCGDASVTGSDSISNTQTQGGSGDDKANPNGDGPGDCASCVQTKVVCILVANKMNPSRSDLKIQVAFPNGASVNGETVTIEQSQVLEIKSKRYSCDLEAALGTTSGNTLHVEPGLYQPRPQTLAVTGPSGLEVKVRYTRNCSTCGPTTETLTLSHSRITLENKACTF